jgi:hypothetical protein
VVKKYAGAVDSAADGFNADFYKYGAKKYNGDHGEAAFLAMAQASKIGGLLIGNIDSRHMLRGQGVGGKHFQEYPLPKELAALVQEGKSHWQMQLSIRISSNRVAVSISNRCCSLKKA